MKLIDKYLLRTVVVPLIYCLMAFAMISILLDLFDNLGDFIEAGTPIPLVALYYANLLPSILYRIVPVAVMLAVIYALYQLSKNNELTAMRACGISLNRMMLPLIILGLFISVTVLAVNETVGPSSAYWCHQFLREQRSDPNRAHFAQIAFKKEKGNRYWYINRFDTRDFSMTGIEIIQMRDRGSNELSKIRAEGGAWLDKSWIFTNVTVQAYDEDGAPHGAPEFSATREMTELNERPQDFLNEIKDPEYLSAFELIRYVKVHRNLEPRAVAATYTDLHNRLAFPWACFVVVLLGIPVGTHTGRKGVLPAVAFSLLMLGSYYGLMMFGLAMGKSMTVAPWVGGWLPIIVYLTVGFGLVARLR